MNLLLNKSNKLFLIIIFLIIFIYYFNYPLVSSKGILIDFVKEGKISSIYGLWGYSIQSIYEILYFLFDKIVSGVFLIQLIFATQVGVIWSIIIFKILNKLNFYAIIIFFTPFILNYYTLCTRDAFSLGLIFLIIQTKWNRLKMIINFLISFFIHKATLPLMITYTFFQKNRLKSNNFFLIFILFSIILSITIHLFLRYSDIISFLPDSSYKIVLSYPRIGFLNQGDISNLVTRAYNFYGNFNFKILLFGLLGQSFCLFFKKNFPNNIFSLSFSTFFICASLSSIPNADRFTYHSFLIAFPFLIIFSINFLKGFVYNKINT